MACRGRGIPWEHGESISNPRPSVRPASLYSDVLVRVLQNMTRGALVFHNADNTAWKQRKVMKEIILVIVIGC